MKKGRKDDAKQLLENEGTVEANKTLAASYLADMQFLEVAAK